MVCNPLGVWCSSLTTMRAKMEKPEGASILLALSVVRILLAPCPLTMPVPAWSLWTISFRFSSFVSTRCPSPSPLMSLLPIDGFSDNVFGFPIHHREPGKTYVYFYTACRCLTINRRKLGVVSGLGINMQEVRRRLSTRVNLTPSTPPNDPSTTNPTHLYPE